MDKESVKRHINKGMNSKLRRHSIIIKSCARQHWSGDHTEWNAELHLWLDIEDDKPPTDVFSHDLKFQTEEECVYFLEHEFRQKVEDIVKGMVKEHPELKVSGSQGGVDIGDKFNRAAEAEWQARNMDDAELPPEEVEEQRMAEAEAKEDR